jgi:5-methylcytosine-specific restriction endonuclease McrA
MTKFFKSVFDRDNHRCVYCGMDLLVSFDVFMQTEEDHLIPISKVIRHCSPSR